MAAIAILCDPVRLTVTAGHRTAQEQLALYQQGRGGKPGPIVTNCDGVQKRSLHQDGRAVDFAWKLPGGAISWDDRHPWDLLGAAAAAVGLRWGGHFTTIKDRPHVEWPYDRPAED